MGGKSVYCTDAGVPMYLYGHSMGGMIAVSTVLRNFTLKLGIHIPCILIVPHQLKIELRIF